MEAELSDYDSQLKALAAQIAADRATLDEMLRENGRGEHVDADLFEATKLRHNSAVDTHNELLQKYKSTLHSYKLLFSTTNEQIDRYNALLRSQ